MKTFCASFEITLNTCTSFVVADAAVQPEKLTWYFAYNFNFWIVGEVYLGKPINTLNVSPPIWLDLLEHSFLFVAQVALDNLGGLLNERATGTEPVALGHFIKDLTPVALLVCSGET